MAVIRVNKTTDYTVMSNAHFKEKEMSLKAKGLLSLMLSLPDDWDYSIMGLVALSADGKDGVMKTLRELEKFGFLKRTRTTNDKGQFAGYDYDIYESPKSEKPNTENPNAEKPYTEKPNTENPPQLNTNTLNTNVSNTKDINNTSFNDEFEKLWKLYPRKIGKDKALAAYIKARKKNGTTFEQVEQGLNNYIAEIKAKKIEKQYIKHGSTWFNNKCWNDEYDSGQAATLHEIRKNGGTYL